jgi:tripartite-type tricarboxylate transporter receptor subunit TctC
MKEGLAKAFEEPTYKRLCERFQLGTVTESENLGQVLEEEYKEMEKLIKAIGLAVKK